MIGELQIYMDTVQRLAERLRNAYTTGAVAPLRDGLPPTDAEAAYAIQTVNTLFWSAQGRRIVGRKIGLTAKAVQAQLGVEQPDFGVLFDDMAIEDGGILVPSKVLQPKAEAEVALVLAHDLKSPSASIHDVMAATAYALPAIEIVDSRIADWKITFADTVADNGSSAFFVLGRTPRVLGGLDLKTCGMTLEVNGRVVSLGAGAACLGHPLNAAAWLARTVARRGDALRAGDIVLTGALGPMVSITVGDVVRAEIGGLGSCGFTYQEKY
jgi:2-keto-4-pentenoate hydratase